MQKLIVCFLCPHYSMESRSTSYHKRKKARGELPPESPPFTLYHTKVVNKCYLDEVALHKAHAYVLHMKFNDEDGTSTTVMKIPSMVYHMQVQDQCMRVFFLVGLQEFFRLKPIQIDAQRVHEFLTTLQEDGSCKITGVDGGTRNVLVDSEPVTSMSTTKSMH